MFRLLVLVVTLSVCMADEEAQSSASPGPVVIPNDHQAEQIRLHEASLHQRDDSHRQHNPHRHRDDRRHDDDEHRSHRQRDDGHRPEHRNEHHDHDDPEGPVILRSIRPYEAGQRPDIVRQNRIISEVYSPDYAEPTWVLDYRYLKTGGRDYTRGPGGQILILPNGIHTNEHKEFRNYDELIEHLRLKNLAGRRKPQYFMPLGEGARRDNQGHEHRAPHSHDERDWWRRN